jgi:putative ABC transport system substrate-binding protein
VKRRHWSALLLAMLPAARGAHAQPAPARIGLLSPTSAQANALRLDALRTALAELGHVLGRNLVIEARFAEGRFDRLPQLARELVALRVDLIVAINTPAALAAARAGGAMPVLIASVGDPVAVGLVSELSRPGGRITGTTNMARDLSAKRLQLLREMLPTARQLAVLTNPDDPIAAVQEADIRGAAPGMGFDVRLFAVRTPAELPAVFDAAVRWRADAVMRIAEPLLTQHRAALVRALQQRRLPSMLVTVAEVREGGLMSYYSVEQAEYRTLAGYIDRILKGANPAELPVQQPTHFELVINQRTARALGIAVPGALLLRADEVIE